MLGFGVPSLRGKNRLNSPAQTASGIGKQTGNKLHKDPRRAATSIVITASLKENEKKKSECFTRIIQLIKCYLLFEVVRQVASVIPFHERVLR